MQPKRDPGQRLVDAGEAMKRAGNGIMAIAACAIVLAVLAPFVLQLFK